MQFGLVGRLLHPDIHGARNFADILGQFSRNLPRFFTGPAHDLNIDRGGHPEIDGLIDDIGRQKIKRRSGKVPPQAGAQPADIIVGGPVIPVEGNQNIRIAGSRDTVIDIGQRDAAGGDADVVEYSGKFLGGDHLPDHGFDAVHEPGGLFDAGSAGARTCNRNWPASTVGKKFCPSCGINIQVPPQKARKRIAKRIRWASTAPRRRR